jgi:phospholipid/cholesterol/gamma-HCH transport system ATP-binding protein
VTAVIEVQGVWKYHLGQPVLRDVTLTVQAGENVGLIGPGGAGKSLLTKLIVGLVKPDRGRVLVEGAAINKLSEIDLAHVRDKFGMLFQNYALFDFLNVGDNIAFPLRQEGRLPEPEIRQRVHDLLRQVNLPGIDHLQVNELSGGMKKRVSFARAIIRDPPILIYDDPTAGLDPVTSSKIFNLLKDIKAKGTTSVTISHDLYGMRDVCDKWAMLYQGRLEFSGTRAEIEQTDNRLVREFWEGGMNLP